MKFIIISAVYNMSKDLDKNIETLKSQNYHNFEVYFGDDMSTDNSAHLIEGLIRDDDRFHLIKHTQKHFSMKNIYRTIEYAKPNDDDIIVLVDGDDRLANENVLALLKKTYEEKKCLMTYGSFSYNGKISRYCKPYPKLVHKTKLYRFFSWRASHLKTFKYSLWKKIPLSSLTLTKKEINRTLFSFLITLRIRSYLNCRKVKINDILTDDLKFVRRCDDKYMTLSMLEIAREKSEFIKEELYIYNPAGAHDFGQSDKKWAQRLLRQAAFLKTRI